MEYLLVAGTLMANMSKLVALVAALALVGAQGNRSGLLILIFADIMDMIM